MQLLWPVLLWNSEVGQSWQLLPLLKRPASHFVQYVWPRKDCTDPLGHGVQLA